MDNIDYADTESINGLNLYAYCNDNPVMYVDPTGEFLDVVLDLFFIAWDIYDLCTDEGYKKGENWLALAIDVIFAVIPFVTGGGGQVVKIGNKIDDALDVAKSIKKLDNLHDIGKVTMIGRDMKRVEATAKILGKADDLYVMWKGYDTSAKGMKRFFHNFLSMGHDGYWLFRKLRTGYTVIDIGVKTTHKGLKMFGLWYGIEKFVLGVWRTRNIWKFPLHYFL